MYDGGKTGSGTSALRTVWPVARGLARSCGKFYDLPLCIKKALVDEFKLLSGRNEKPPEKTPEWYLFFADVFRIADSKGVITEFVERVEWYSEHYPWNLPTAKPLTTEIPPTPEVFAMAEEERFKRWKRAKNQEYYYSRGRARLGVKRKNRGKVLTPEQRIEAYEERKAYARAYTLARYYANPEAEMEKRRIYNRAYKARKKAERLAKKQQLTDA